MSGFRDENETRASVPDNIRKRSNSKKIAKNLKNSKIKHSAMKNWACTRKS